MGNIQTFLFPVQDKRPQLSDEKWANIASTLSDSILGQGPALQRIQELLIDARNQSHSTAPFCTMLFLGPPNMGKTPTCKALAGAIYESEENIFRIDMSSYNSDLYTKKLKSTLKKISQGPGKVVILYDVDMAHKSALELVENVIFGTHKKGKWNFNACVFICTMTTAEHEGLRDVEAILRRSSLQALAEHAVTFQPLHAAFLPGIVEIAWEHTLREVTHGNSVRAAGNERTGIRLTQEDINETIVKLFDPRLGWQDCPKLARHLLDICWERMGISGSNTLLRFRNAPKLSDKDEPNQPEKRKRNEEKEVHMKKQKFETKTGHNSGRDSTAIKSHNPNSNSHNPNSHNPRIKSHNTTTTTTTVHEPSVQATSVGESTAPDSSHDTDRPSERLDISSLIGKPLQLFVPPECVPETARFQRGFAIGGTDLAPVFMRRAEPHSNSVVFELNEFTGEVRRAHIKNGMLTYGRQTDKFEIEKFGNGFAVKYGLQYLGLKPSLKIGIQDTPFEFGLSFNFAPVRQNINIDFYIDGEEYFTKIYDELLNAKHSICIFDWMFSHQTNLIRPQKQPNHELGTLLEMKASEGIKIKILLYNNIESFVPNNHAEVVNRFEGTKNIEVALQSCNLTKISRWSHHQKGVIIDFQRAYIGGLDLADNRWDSPNHHLCEPVKGHYPGQDFRNPFVENMDRNKDPRMPWHDVQIGVDGEAAYDVAINFIQRWNTSSPNLIKFESLPRTSKGNGDTPCQITRSMHSFYCGENYNEKSIRSAFVHAITAAKSFVYIESQYFIDMTQNRPIISAILNRVTRAIEGNEAFTVAIVLPQMPDNGNPQKSDAKLIMHYQHKTIQYLIDQINLKSFKRAKEYINFYSLRNCELSSGGIVTESIYVHAKILISDEICIVGSANLNDRSMNGAKDSEIGAVVYSAEKSKLLLSRLVEEHTGSKQEMGDVCQFFKGTWRSLAKENSAVYVEVFGYGLPDGEPESFELYEQGKNQKPNEAAQTKLHQLRGHLVNFPFQFLRNELQTLNLSQVSLDLTELCL